MPPLNKFKRFDVRGLLGQGIEPFPQMQAVGKSLAEMRLDMISAASQPASRSPVSTSTVNLRFSFKPRAARVRAG